jgi:hypothetical protein
MKGTTIERTEPQRAGTRCSVHTRDTHEWGTGCGRVAEGLPGPIPVHTLPTTGFFTRPVTILGAGLGAEGPKGV